MLRVSRQRFTDVHELRREAWLDLPFFQTESTKPVFSSSWMKLESTTLAGSKFLARGSRSLQRLEHELDPLHVDVRNAVLKSGDDFIGGPEDIGIAILREISGDFQDKFTVLLVDTAALRQRSSSRA